MKNKVIILMILLVFISCSKDDQEEGTFYTADVELGECGGISTELCISKEQYERIDAPGHISNPCRWVSIEDVNGRFYSGYLRSYGKSSSKPDVCR